MNVCTQGFEICESLMRKITICKGYGFNLNTWAIQHGLTDQHKSVLRTLTEKERDAMFMCCTMMYPCRLNTSDAADDLTRAEHACLRNSQLTTHRQ